MGKFGKEWGMDFMEVSALMNINVDEVFDLAVITFFGDDPHRGKSSDDRRYELL